MAVVLSFRVDDEKVERLERLAAATDRPRSWLLEQALDAYLDAQGWQIEHIRQGLEDVEAGREVPHEEVAAWLESWGTENELEPPAIEEGPTPAPGR